MSEKPLFVDANYRFIAAYQEVNARIVQRHQALTLYVTLTASLLAAQFALHPGAGGADLPAAWLALGFPVATLCLAFLNYKAERAITNLRSFLASLERLHGDSHHLPGYNMDPRWAGGNNRVRRFHDYAAAVMATGANLIGIGAATRGAGDRPGDLSLLLGLAAVAAVVSVAALLVVPRWSYRPLDL